MVNKFKEISKYLLYSLLSIVIYGSILYFVCTWLAKYSLLYAYLGNLVLIILALALDEFIYKVSQSEKTMAQIKKEKNADKIYRYMQNSSTYALSYKTDLYLFYVFILVFSQIIEFNPTLVGENFGNFILTNSYSILILIAIDMLIGQFSKDKERAKKRAEKMKKYFSE